MPKPSRCLRSSSTRRKRYAVGLGREPQAVGKEQYRMVEADQRDQLEDLFDTEGRSKRIPHLVREVRRVVQLIDRPDKQPFLVAPGRVVRITAHRRAYLFGRQGDALGEECNMHSPLVGAAAARAGAVDYDLAVAQ